MPMHKPWVPSAEVCEWLRSKYRYDDGTGEVTYAIESVYRPGTKGRRVFAATVSGGYLRVKLSNRRLLGCERALQLHRLVWILCYGKPPATELDHIDGDKKNNRIENLRLSDRTLNQANVSKRSGPFTSKYKGVRFHKSSGKWQARIGYRGLTRCIGQYSTEAEAALAYNQQALAIYGEHARINLVA